MKSSWVSKRDRGSSILAMTGYLELVAGPLLMMGLFVRQTALVVSVEALLAYVLIAQPRTLWPIRNGGIEALLYFVVLLYFAVAGAGAWSLDARKAGSAVPEVGAGKPQIA